MSRDFFELFRQNRSINKIHRKNHDYIRFSSLAFAFQPSHTTWIGKEPNRIQYFDIEVQFQLRQQEFWQRFIKENPNWNARFDQKTLLPYRAWGKGISFDVSDLMFWNRSFANGLMHKMFLESNPPHYRLKI